MVNDASGSARESFPGELAIESGTRLSKGRNEGCEASECSPSGSPVPSRFPNRTTDAFGDIREELPEELRSEASQPSLRSSENLSPFCSASACADGIAAPEGMGAIFDCDGTLIDSVGGWRAVEQEFARMCGHELTLEEMKLLATFTLQETGAFYHNNFGLGKSGEHVVEMADEILVDFYRTQVVLRPGVGDFLEGLAHAGVPMTVASSSPQRYLQGGLAHTGIIDYFQAVFSTDDVGAPKRQPTIYQAAARHMGTPIVSTWGFEDSIYAVRTLVNNGFKCAGCYDRDDSATMQQLHAEATFVIPSFAECTAQEFLAAARKL